MVGQKTLLQDLVEHHIRSLQRLGGGEEGVSEELLRQLLHPFHLILNLGQISGGSGGLLRLFQQLQIAADGSKRGPEIVREVGHRLLELPVSILVPAPLLAQTPQLPVELGCQPPDIGVPGQG